MSSILKVDTIQDQDGNNIINESGNVITIGASGDTITVPAGATLSGDLNASNLTSGTVPDARITGAYTGITNLTITTADNSDTLTLKSTDADANAGPILALTRDSGSPADNDVLGRVIFKGDDDAGNVTNFLTVDTRIADASNGSEDFKTVFSGVVAGTERHVFTLGSTEAVFNDGSQDIDFRVESNNNANMLCVDANNDRVGIGTITPSSLLHIYSSEPTLIIQDGGTHGVNATPSLSLRDGSGAMGSINFSAAGLMRINQVKNSSLTFHTNNTEVGRFDTSGTLLVGKTNTTANVSGTEIEGSGTIVSTRASNVNVFLNRTGNDGSLIEFRKDNSTVGNIGVVSTNNFFIGTEDAGFSFRGSVPDITPADFGSGRDNLINLGAHNVRYKDLYLGGGVYLGGTGSANKLEDYEEGTFTPTFSHGITSVGYNNQAGRYTKVGDIVYFDLNIQTNAGSGANTRLRISGFPFTANGSGAGNASIGFTDNALINSTTTNLPTLFKEPSTLDFYNSGGGQMVGTDLNNPASINIYISGVYKTT